MTAVTPPEDPDPLERVLVDAIALLRADDRTAPLDAATVARLRSVFLAQIRSRILDHTARWLRAQGHGYYTISSAGHEANALVATALRPTDPALLHYRSGAFHLLRSAQVGRDGSDDILLGCLASVDEPIAGGRHKVIGHPDVATIPQTSTIASHLPRAVGVAFTVGRSGGQHLRWPADAVTVCSFGDASLNHSTAQGALNATAWAAHQHLRVPLLFVCEDNGLGISVPTPAGWVAASAANRPELRYERADGQDAATTLLMLTELVAWIRDTGRPAFVHLDAVRYLGHAGTDVEAAYRAPGAIRSELGRDPIVGTAAALVAAGAATPQELAAAYAAERTRIHERAARLIPATELATVEAVVAPLAPRHANAVADAVTTSVAGTARRGEVFDPLPETTRPLTLAETINRTLAEALAADDATWVFGEDVARKGGVYGVTRGLQKRFGPTQVFDTLLDEQTVLGVALGAAVSGIVPIPEIQYLAYLHNAEDQLRGEAATLQFFSNGAYRNGMVVRVAGYGYQKGFGGHFHNDNALAVLRDVPGIVIASPAHPTDAAPMLRTCLAAARVDGTVSVFLEPIARYHQRDLHTEGDGGWLAPYADPVHWRDEHVPIGAPTVARPGDDVVVFTWANGRYMSERVAARVAGARGDGPQVRVVDLRWLAPLPHDELLAHAQEVGRVVVVDETRRSGGVSEAIVTGLVEGGFRGAIVRIAAADSFVPLGDAANLVLVSEADIERAISDVLG